MVTPLKSSNNSNNSNINNSNNNYNYSNYNSNNNNWQRRRPSRPPIPRLDETITAIAIAARTERRRPRAGITTPQRRHPRIGNSIANKNDNNRRINNHKSRSPPSPVAAA